MNQLNLRQLLNLDRIETENYKLLEIIRNSIKFPAMAMNCPDIKYAYKMLKENAIEVENINVTGTKFSLTINR